MAGLHPAAGGTRLLQVQQAQLWPAAGVGSSRAEPEAAVVLCKAGRRPAGGSGVGLLFRWLHGATFNKSAAARQPGISRGLAARWWQAVRLGSCTGAGTRLVLGLLQALAGRLQCC